jgi:tRNA1Val (adenine37-N6)-methyltransferase
MMQPDWHEPVEWPDDAQRDRLIGGWYLYQRRGGHRTSTDDVVTAWFAASRLQAIPDRYLDLGCGIGSVLLMTAHRLRPRQSFGVEAQLQSVLMARRTVAELSENAPFIEIVHADMRSSDLPKSKFDLITGSPPYFPLGTGSLPDDAQRRACRFEARGGVEAYCATASRHLSDAGRFYIVFQTLFDDRVQSAAAQSGLRVSARADLKMREDRDESFLTVYEMSSVKEQSRRPVECTGFAIRDALGEITERYAAARMELGVG